MRMLVLNRKHQQQMAREELQELWRLAASHKLASLRRIWTAKKSS